MSSSSIGEQLNGRRSADSQTSPLLHQSCDLLMANGDRLLVGSPAAGNCSHSETLGRRYQNNDNSEEIATSSNHCCDDTILATNIANTNTNVSQNISFRNNNNQQPIINNTYSEIITPASATPTPQSHLEPPNKNTLPDEETIDGSHYQAPAASVAYAVVQQSIKGAPSVNDERNQLMESKRRRTLMMLRDKEAPRASIEQASPTDENNPIRSSPNTQDNRRAGQLDDGNEEEEEEPLLLERRGRAEITGSPVISDYENVGPNNTTSAINSNYRDDDDADHHQRAFQQPTTDQKNPNETCNMAIGGLNNDLSSSAFGQPKPLEPELAITRLNELEEQCESFVSPSESSQTNNFNTLSLVSDILGDLSQEEDSIVQQLSQG